MDTRERALPFGSAPRVEGNRLVFPDGHSLNLNQIFGHSFCVDPLLGHTIISNLCEEIDLLRRLLKQALKNEHIPIVDSNEFYRRIASIAHKIDYEISGVRAILQPILEQLIAEMFAPRAPKMNRHKKGGHRGNIPQTREMHQRDKHLLDEDIR